MLSLKRKNCSITGATGGIGREIAKIMAEEGCNLFLTSTTKWKLNRLSESLERKYNVRVNTYIHNFYSPVTFTPPINKTDILINCAGIYLHKELIETNDEEMRKLFSINLVSVINTCKAVIPHMKEQYWGRIVNIGSIAAYQGFPKNSLYCASKHAVLGFSRALRGELKNYNIRVYCISPAATQTKMGNQIPFQDSTTFIKPKDIAEYIKFLIKFDGNSISEEVRINRFQV